MVKRAALEVDESQEKENTTPDMEENEALEAEGGEEVPQHQSKRTRLSQHSAGGGLSERDANTQVSATTKFGIVEELDVGQGKACARSSVSDRLHCTRTHMSHLPTFPNMGL